jgi:hypothetical protein
MSEDGFCRPRSHKYTALALQPTRRANSSRLQPFPILKNAIRIPNIAFSPFQSISVAIVAQGGCEIWRKSKMAEIFCGNN